MVFQQLRQVLFKSKQIHKKLSQIVSNCQNKTISISNSSKLKWKKIYLKMSCVLYNKEQISLASYMIKYFKQRPPDCTLFSEDNCKILIHKELLYQTQYMRSMIKSATIGCCCSQIEILCPSMTINELEIIVQFLYRLFLMRLLQSWFYQLNQKLQVNDF